MDYASRSGSVKSGQSGASRASISVTLPTTEQRPGVLPYDGYGKSEIIEQSLPDDAYSHISAGTIPPAGTPTKTLLEKQE